MQKFENRKFGMKKQKSLYIILMLALILCSLVQGSKLHAASKLSLNKSKLNLAVNKTYQLKVKNATSKVSWSTNNKKVATVKNGKIKGLRSGTATITAKSGAQTFKCNVTVYTPTKKVTLTPSLNYIEEGNKFSVKPSFSPKDASYQSLTWSVVNDDTYRPAVKQISKNKFEAVNEGEATIIAYQKQTNKTYKLNIYVEEKLGGFGLTYQNQPIKTINASVGRRTLIDVNNDDEDIELEDLELKYKIKDESIATLDSKGQITGKSIGRTELVVTAKNGVSISYDIIVSNPMPYNMDVFYADNMDGKIEYSNYNELIYATGLETIFSYNLPGNQLGIFEYIEKNGKQWLQLKIYNSTYQFLSEKKIELPYTVFGGMHRGDDGFYYVAVGQENPNEEASKITYCILKYDSDFVEIARTNITGIESYTTVPYRCGTARMEQYENNLIVHTDRLRYRSDDGLNHQSNISFIIDTTTMNQLYVSKDFPYNHVSHSFNQFVKFDGNNLIYVDHGDAYPRALVMQTHYDFSPFGWGDNYKDRPNTYENEILPFVNNVSPQYQYTKAEVNGFELGSEYNIAAGTSVPHDKLSNPAPGEVNVKNVYVLLTSKDGYTTNLVWLTDYKEGGNVSAENLRFVKISDDKFALLYEITGKDSARTGLFLVDSAGNILSAKEYPGAFNGNVQPVLFNSSIVWLEQIEKNNFNRNSDVDLRGFHVIDIE